MSGDGSVRWSVLGAGAALVIVGIALALAVQEIVGGVLIFAGLVVVARGAGVAGSTPPPSG